MAAAARCRGSPSRAPPPEEEKKKKVWRGDVRGGEGGRGGALKQELRYIAEQTLVLIYWAGLRETSLSRPNLHGPDNCRPKLHRFF